VTQNIVVCCYWTRDTLHLLQGSQYLYYYETTSNLPSSRQEIGGHS